MTALVIAFQFPGLGVGVSFDIDVQHLPVIVLKGCSTQSCHGFWNEDILDVGKTEGIDADTFKSVWKIDLL